MGLLYSLPLSCPNALPPSINFHLEINNPEETSKLEADFAEEVKKRGEDFKYYKDQVFIPCK